MNITLAYDRKDDIRQLFKEYTAMLIEADETIKDCLAVQGYDEELNHLEEKYGLPDGRLYGLSCSEGQSLVGCVALRRLDESCCELKRLYIQPAWRGQGLSCLLLEVCIREARKIGYAHMRLDTLSFLTAAVRLYKKYGFYEIPPYYDNPAEAIFMQLDL